MCVFFTLKAHSCAEVICIQHTKDVFPTVLLRYKHNKKENQQQALKYLTKFIFKNKKK